MAVVDTFAPDVIAPGTSSPEPLSGPEKTGRFAVTFRRSAGEEQRLLGASEDELRERTAALWPAGWRLRHLRGHAAGSSSQYSAVWKTSLRSQLSVFGVALEEMTERYRRLWEQGWRLSGINAHPVVTAGKTVLAYTATWEPGREPERQVYGVPLATLEARRSELAGQGWRLTSLSATADPRLGEPRYTAVWRPGVTPELVLHQLSQDVFQARYERLWIEGWRLKLLAPYAERGHPRFTAAWTRSSSAEITMPATTRADLEARYPTLSAQGWRLRFLEPF